MLMSAVTKTKASSVGDIDSSYDYDHFSSGHIWGGFQVETPK